MIARLGLLRLADSLPILAALRQGAFSARGIAMQVSVEPSWSNTLDKLAFGALDMAVMPPSLALAAAAGLRGPRTKLIVPCAISQGGNSVVLGGEAARAAGSNLDPHVIARHLGAWIKTQPVLPGIAVVHAFSTHALLVRDWLAQDGIDPDHDAELVVIPPAEVVDSLLAGRVCGFCAGAPWGNEAVLRGAGRIVLGTDAIRPSHTEKCLAVTEAWARSAPESLVAIQAALAAIAPACADRSRAEEHAALLAGPPLALPYEATLTALRGGWECRPDFVPSHDLLADGAWYAAQLSRWGWDVGDPVALAHAVFVNPMPSVVTAP